MYKKVVLCLVYNQSQILLQLRNLNADIVHPGTWGFFSGTIDINENPKNAVKRELNEELGITSFRKLNFVFRHYDSKTKSFYYIYTLKSSMKKFRLNEGLDLSFFKTHELLKKKKSKKIGKYFNCADPRLMRIFYYKCKKIIN